MARPVLLKPHERIIPALDSSNLSTVASLVDTLRGHVGSYKVGLQLMNAILNRVLAPEDEEEAIQQLKMARRVYRGLGGTGFWDGKLHDVGNTLKGAVSSMFLPDSPLKVAMVNLHASTGREAIEQAVAQRGNADVLAVTVLTSLSEQECLEIYGALPKDKVPQLARLAAEAGVQGFVCSALEVGDLRKEFPNMILVVPGTRSPGVSAHDQKRVGTPCRALEDGADYLVVGRQITEAGPEVGGPVGAAVALAEEISSVC